MAGLWIAHANLQDPDTYAEYSKAAGEVVAAHDGSSWPAVAITGSWKARSSLATS
jgi:uncharacterized protein (DUF1330 family)